MGKIKQENKNKEKEIKIKIKIKIKEKKRKGNEKSQKRGEEAIFGKAKWQRVKARREREKRKKGFLLLSKI